MLESAYKNKGFVNSIYFSSSNMLKNQWNINIFDFNNPASPSCCFAYPVRPESKLNWKWAKSGSGAPGPKSALRDTKSTTFAKGFFQPSNLLKYLLKYHSNHLLKYIIEIPFEIPLEIHFEIPVEIPPEIPLEIRPGIPLELSLEIHLEIRFEIPLETHFEIRLGIPPGRQHCNSKKK